MLRTEAGTVTLASSAQSAKANQPTVSTVSGRITAVMPAPRKAPSPIATTGQPPISAGTATVPEPPRYPVTVACPSCMLYRKLSEGSGVGRTTGSGVGRGSRLPGSRRCSVSG